ncbi:hypothetical protein [Mycolicibacterium gadium]|uniref:Uncharacterized protein n=1 Tax=Mycolicibacterium gadium TaxID=1794 RepID=A0A7I7WNC2_MYCGU|nr:hypothetical protein [Mycolicibacterium gadium]BBZ19044.1 hypothetical protein MGAD_33790 [Mycolicibacterium gadium]
METLTGLLAQHGTETLAARGGRLVGSHRHDRRPTLACQRYPAVSRSRLPTQWGMLTLTQVLAAAIFSPAMMFSLMALAAAAFRAGQRDPEITQAFSDFSGCGSSASSSPSS